MFGPFDQLHMLIMSNHYFGSLNVTTWGDNQCFFLNLP